MVPLPWYKKQLVIPETIHPFYRLSTAYFWWRADLFGTVGGDVVSKSEGMAIIEFILIVYAGLSAFIPYVFMGG